MAKFSKGHEKVGGKKKGTPNKKTQQWDAFSTYCLEGGLERFQEEIEKLKGKDFINAYLALLEYHKPKLARSEIKQEGESKMIITIVRE